MSKWVKMDIVYLHQFFIHFCYDQFFLKTEADEKRMYIDEKLMLTELNGRWMLTEFFLSKYVTKRMTAM